jgi:hypothetical protein
MCQRHMLAAVMGYTHGIDDMIDTGASRQERHWYDACDVMRWWFNGALYTLDSPALHEPPVQDTGTHSSPQSWW